MNPLIVAVAVPVLLSVGILRGYVGRSTSFRASLVRKAFVACVLGAFVVAPLLMPTKTTVRQVPMQEGPIVTSVEVLP